MAAGYFKRFRMAADLLRIRRPAPLPSGYRFVPWNEALLDVHARTKYHAFRDEIDAVVFPCLGDPEGCRRLMREIRDKAGFLPLATWLIVRGDSPAAVDWCGTIQGVVDETGAGSIQNIGIVPGHRGIGLGTALIERALAGFRDWGAARATLEVTADNSGAVRLYQRLGFRRQRTVYKVVDGVAERPACTAPAAVAAVATLLKGDGGHDW
jgi:ribosomal protein S18 acetylase RimI-like enzyme